MTMAMIVTMTTITTTKIHNTKTTSLPWWTNTLLGESREDNTCEQISRGMAGGQVQGLVCEFSSCSNPRWLGVSAESTEFWGFFPPLFYFVNKTFDEFLKCNFEMMFIFWILNSFLFFPHFFCCSILGTLLVITRNSPVLTKDKLNNLSTDGIMINRFHFLDDKEDTRGGLSRLSKGIKRGTTYVQI